MNLPFDLEKAKQGHPLISRDNRKAKFIAYVKDCLDGHRLIVHLENAVGVTAYYDNGKSPCANYDLFLYKETKTVWYVDVWILLEGDSKPSLKSSTLFEERSGAQDALQQYSRMFSVFKVNLREVVLEYPA